MRLLHLATTIVMVTALCFIFFYAPIEKDKGVVQKIFYIHVTSAITMYFGFFIAFLGSILFIMEKKLFWDEIAVAGAEVSFLLCTLVLITGSIWARPIWGVYWTWEPRLTTTTLLWLLYSGSIVLRSYFGEDDRKRVVTAILWIIDFLTVPLVHFSVKLWRGVHPTVLGPQGGGISPAMKLVFLITFVAVLFLFSSL